MEKKFKFAPLWGTNVMEDIQLVSSDETEYMDCEPAIYIFNDEEEYYAFKPTNEKNRCLFFKRRGDGSLKLVLNKPLLKEIDKQWIEYLKSIQVLRIDIYDKKLLP